MTDEYKGFKPGKLWIPHPRPNGPMVGQEMPDEADEALRQRWRERCRNLAPDFTALTTPPGLKALAEANYGYPFAQKMSELSAGVVRRVYEEGDRLARKYIEAGGDPGKARIAYELVPSELGGLTLKVWLEDVEES